MPPNFPFPHTPGQERVVLVLHALFDLDREPFDFLIKSRKRDAELLRRVGLVPLAALQLVDDDAPLNILQNVEQRGIRIVLQQAGGVAAAGEVAGKKVESDRRCGGKNHSALDYIFQFAHIARPVVIHQHTHGFRSERARR
jgi:hypothetical protein